jgi:16S rRNA (cytosine967-C5)-methyltransferase
MAEQGPVSPRALAFRSLAALERDGRYANLEIDARLKETDRSKDRSENGMSREDRALYTRLVYGVTERRITLDHILSQYASRPAEETDPAVKCALRLGLYQLLYMDRIPDHAAVDETVALVKREKKNAAGFVNAVLRSFLRAGKKWTLPDEGDKIGFLSVKHSVPEALIRVYETALPRDASSGELDELLAALNREPGIGLRVNTLRMTAEEAAETLGAEPSRIAPDVVKTDTLSEAARRGIEEGLWFVQDEASRIASAAVGAGPGDLTADVCACPGGKTFSMALDMRNRGTVLASDLHGNKLSLVRRGAERLGLDIVRTAVRDARDPDPELVGRADRVLCDAPCSGFGVIAKKPDLRYKDPSTAERLPGIQREILEGASAYVKPGGVLIYSTCTLNRAENEEVAQSFLREHPEFVPDEDPRLGGWMRTFFPHRDGTDGFFAARMKRRAE